jgi:hypothetical protein
MAHLFSQEKAMNRAAALLLCGFLFLVACNKSAPPSAQTKPVQPAPAAVTDKVPDFEFEPLRQSDLDLYLSVMKAAVDKFHNLPPEDRKALADYEKWHSRLQSGYHKPWTPQEQAMITRYNELHDLDYEVAHARGQYELYSAVRGAIEGMVGPMKCDNSDCGEGEPESDPKLRAKQLEEDTKRKAIIEQDLVLLKPHETQITDLIKQIRP